MPKKTPVMGVCKLCQLPAELKNSHVVSKFMYRAAGMVGDKYGIKCVSNPTLSEYNKQDGLKEYMLCGVCEGLLSKREDYARKQFYGHNSPFKTVTEKGFVWSGLDYAKMKLFTCSILLRMSFSTHPLYAAVELGDKHEKRLRDMLLSENPLEAWRYGSSIVYLCYGKNQFPPIFSQPNKYRFPSSRCVYWFIVAGLLIYIDVASHPPMQSERLNYLMSDGTWIIKTEHALNIPYIKEEIDLVRSHEGVIP